MSTGVQSTASRGNIVLVPEVNFAELSLCEIEKTSRYLELLAGLKESFKTDLHAHLGGAVSKAFLKKYSTAQEYAELMGFIEKLRGGIDYTDGFKAFSMIGRVLNSNQRIEEAAFDFCQNQNNDNVTFTELRTGLKRLDGGFEDYLKAVIAGLKRGMKAYPIRVTLVRSLRRETSFSNSR